MKLLNFTIIKLCICFIIGIVLNYYVPFSRKHVFIFTLINIIILSLTFLIARKRFIKTIWFGLFTVTTTISLGALVTQLHEQKNFSNHYTKKYNKKEKESKNIRFRVKEVLKQGKYNNRYIIDILKIENHNVSGKALLNIKRDSVVSKLEVDDVLLIKEEFIEIQNPLNPNQFNYKTYLEKKYIYHQVYTTNSKLFFLSKNKHTFIGYASKLRNTINLKLQKHRFHADELAIINALLLGQRQDISKDIYINYVNAGAIHILAVSGLHVGILLLLLNFILKPIELFKQGRNIKMATIIILLWTYAIIAGASASIIRAATMFSIVAIGMHLKRPTNIYNTLAISIFFILLFKPMFLFDIGFQLSYLAVFAIVSIQPILYSLWKPDLWLINKLWEIFTVTIAAQLGVLPISLFYFHQFPGLFWLSNMIIIPLLGIILATGILIIVLALIDILPSFFAECYGLVIRLMNTFFEWIASQEQFLFSGISFNFLQVIASYFILIAMVRIQKNKNFKTCTLLCFSIMSFQMVSIYLKYENNKNAFLIFHKSRHTIIGEKNNNKLKVFHNSDSLMNKNVIKGYQVAHSISSITEDSIQNFYTYQNKNILIIDSLGVYNFQSIQADFILLRDSPKINLNRVLDSISPKSIIVDGSNYKSYIARWEATCKKRKLPFHQTGKKGAFILE